MMTERDIETFRYRAMDRVVAWMTRDRYPTALLAGGIALLGKNIIISMIEIAAKHYSEWQTISLPSFGLPEGIGLALVMASLGFRVLPSLKTNKKQRYQAARKLYREYDQLTPAELQTRFSFVFGIPAPPYEAIRALLSHPSDPAGIVDRYIKGRYCVKWNGDWFSMRGRFEHIDYTINIILMIILFIIYFPILFIIFNMATSILNGSSMKNQYYTYTLYGILLPLVIYYQMIEIRAYRKARDLVRCGRGK